MGGTCGNPPRQPGECSQSPYRRSTCVASPLGPIGRNRIRRPSRSDDLFVALHRRMMDATVEELETLLDCESPLAAYWQFQSQRAQAALGVEFIALANHRKAIRADIAACAEHARELQVEMLAAALARTSVTPGVCSPLSLAILLNGIARTLVNEESIGIEADMTRCARRSSGPSHASRRCGRTDRTLVGSPKSGLQQCQVVNSSTATRSLTRLFTGAPTSS